MHLLRHITACNNTSLPGGRLSFIVGGHPVGWLWPMMAERLPALGARLRGQAVHLDDAGTLPSFGRGMADAGLYGWRGEAFDVWTEAGARVGQIDRGALPMLGLRAAGVHLNGLVASESGLQMWLGRRAAGKPLDPGKLDNIAAGGIAAGLDAAATLAKEAAEEAGLPPELLAAAKPVSTLAYVMERPEGLRRDLLHCYDVLLPADFVPQPIDGEVAAFELWPVTAVLDAVRRCDRFKFNVNLVLIDFFIRHRLLPAAESASLQAALRRSPA